MIIALGYSSEDFIYPIIWFTLQIFIFGAPLIINLILINKDSLQLGGKQSLLFYLLLFLELFYYDLQSTLDVDKMKYTMTIVKLLPFIYLVNYFISRSLFKEIKNENREQDESETELNSMNETWYITKEDLKVKYYWCYDTVAILAEYDDTEDGILPKGERVKVSKDESWGSYILLDLANYKKIKKTQLSKGRVSESFLLCKATPL